MTAATIIQRQAEVQADRLGMAEMKIAVRLRRKAGANSCRIKLASFLLIAKPGFAGPASLSVLAGGQISINDVANEIGRRRYGGRGFQGVAHVVFLDSRRAVF